MRRAFLKTLTVLLFSSFASGKDDKLSFNDAIRPILSDRCFACHGFDANTREADLRLDTAEAAYAPRENGPAIVPGHPEESDIWKRIISTEKDDVMPPYDSHLSLSSEEKAILKQWIEEGAEYEPHWAFTEVRPPEVQATKSAAIDEIVREQLLLEGLSLSPQTDKNTLIRRLSLSLRGLPPTPKEIEHYLTDEHENATEQLVDRLLADSAFGERFAWPWMDAARYADSNGYQQDKERTMYPWRDWVVRAINENLPYDQFTIWQLAGDLLPEPTFEQKLATGFLRNHPINGEGGVVPEENRVNYVMDMAETAGTVWLGLTMNCCRCHDHKYDPISQAEYYGLFAFFNQTPVTGQWGNPQTPPILAVSSEEERQQEHKLRKEQQQLVEHLQSIAKKEALGQKQWEEEQKAHPSAWRPLIFDELNTLQSSLTLQGDFTVLASKSSAAKENYTLTAPLEPGQLSQIRLDAVPHPKMTRGGFSRSQTGKFLLSEITFTLVTPEGERQALEVASAHANLEDPAHPISAAFDGEDITGWSIGREIPSDKNPSAVFHLKEEIAVPLGTRIEVALQHQSSLLHSFLDSFMLSSHGEITPQAINEKQPQIALTTALAIASNKRSAAQKEFIRRSYLSTFEAYQKTNQKLTKTTHRLTKHDEQIPKVMIMADQKEYRPTPILTTGLYNQPTEQFVPPHTPGVLLPLKQEDEFANRLDLARWLVDEKNPLTARVTVNRVWQELFGIGLVKTTEDFGLQGELPRYRDLLDWLAIEFIESGWDFKDLIRTIVLSKVYQQSSRVTPSLYEKDPQNRLLARGPRFRMPSWMIRDYALASSGLLVDKIGGLPVKPYQPAGLWAEVTFGGGKKVYQQDTGEALYRRSLYTFWRRISAPPMFFDNSARMVCDVKSHRTNTPLHSLYTLNEPIFVEASRNLATELLQQSADTNEMVASAFKRILGRDYDQSEEEVLREFLQENLLDFAQDPAAAKALIEVGETPVDTTLAPEKLAALTTLILSLLNTDEALTIE